MLAKFSGLNAKGPSLSLEQENFFVVFTYSIKQGSEISKFHAVMQQWPRNVQKSVIHVQSCSFANLNLLLACCSPSPLQTLPIVVIQKFCYHGNVTSHFSSLSVFPKRIPGELDPLSSYRPHLDYGMTRSCLVPRPHYHARPMPFGSRGPRKFVSDTSPKCIDREGLKKRRTGTGKA